MLNLFQHPTCLLAGKLIVSDCLPIYGMPMFIGMTNSYV